LEGQMSKRTPTTPSKHVHSPKIAAKGQRAAQDIVRSPKDRRPRSVGADSTESLPNRHTDSEQTAPLVENPVTALQQEALLVENQATALQQEAFLVENPATALQNDRKQMMADISTKKGFDFFFVSQGERASLSSKAAGNGTSQHAICFGIRSETCDD